MKIILRKDLNGFRPVCDEGERVLRGMKLGQSVMVNFSFPRNIGHHRKFFALMEIIFKNQEAFQSTDQMLNALKLAIGHTESIKTRRGVFEIPKSISFARMDQTEFESFYNRAVDFFTEEVIPGLGKEELAQEVAELCR